MTDQNERVLPIGPWTDEPNVLHWVDSGLDCLIVRNHSGALCGYVGLPEGHKYFEEHYQNIRIDVHGGITYSSPKCTTDSIEFDKLLYWIGFDCSHSWDYSPMFDYNFESVEQYKNIEYVKNEINSMIEQLTNGE